MVEKWPRFDLRYVKGARSCRFSKFDSDVLSICGCNNVRSLVLAKSFSVNCNPIARAKDVRGGWWWTALQCCTDYLRAYPPLLFLACLVETFESFKLTGYFRGEIRESRHDAEY